MQHATFTVKNVTVKNSVVTGGHNSAAILGYACSTAKGHLFENCQVLNTFVGGYAFYVCGLVQHGFCKCDGQKLLGQQRLLYSDALTFQSSPLLTNYNSDLWLGTLYNDYCFVLDEDEWRLCLLPP